MELIIYDRIRNRKVTFFNQFQVSLKHDSVASTFSFSMYFDPDNLEHKELACIGHYHVCRIMHNGELLITGVNLSTKFSSQPEAKLIEIGGYSLPGVLEDSDIPTGLFPLQNDGKSLKQITEALIKPFGLKLVIDPAVYQRSQKPFVATQESDPAADKGYVKPPADYGYDATPGTDKINKGIKSSSAKVSQNIKSYLTELATQRNVVLSHDEQGNLLFTKCRTDKPAVARFDVRDSSVTPGTTSIGTEMHLDFDGQQMHSHITVLKQADEDGGNAGEVTLRNPYVINTVFRPKVIVQDSGDEIDTHQAAKNAIAAELKGLKLTIKTDRWTVDGKLLRPNSIIEVYNPEIYLYKLSKWFIESIDYVGEGEENMTATLTCVLPCVYDDTPPEYLFKGINLH